MTTKKKRDYPTSCTSVTTVIGAMLAKPALVFWGYRKGCEAVGAEVLSLVDAERPISRSDVELAIEIAKDKRVHERLRDAAADAGTLAHSLIEAHIAGETFSIEGAEPAALAKAERAFTKWLRWFVSSGAEVVCSEHAMVNETVGLAGTLDAVVMIGGRRIIADWKTGKDAYDDVILQVAGYEALWVADTAQAFPIDGALVVNVPVEADNPIKIYEITREQLDVGRVVFASMLHHHKQIKSGLLKLAKVKS